MNSYLFPKLLELAEHFKNEPSDFSKNIGNKLVTLAEVVMAAEKLKRGECGWSDEEVAELLTQLIK